MEHSYSLFHPENQRDNPRIGKLKESLKLVKKKFSCLGFMEKRGGK
jgi:hypothetical protein